MRRAAVLLLLAACKNNLPSAISLQAVEQAPDATLELRDREEALRYVLAGDPLVRRPKLPPDEVLAKVAGAEALYLTASEIRRFEGGHDLTGGLKLIGDRRAGTETAVITRGYRLGLADRLLGAWASDPGDVAMHELAPLLSGLLRDEQAAQRRRNALDVLVDDGVPFPDAVRRHGDRWVLTAWLDGPAIPLGPAVQALAAPAYDRLRESRLGRLVVARAEGRAGDPAAGLADLKRATALALQKASSDRHREQGEWSDARKTAAAELGVDDPIGFLLDRAADRLTDAAGADVGAGGALLALTARRIVGGCDWTPCQGPDRVATLAAAGRWSPELVPLARVWRVVALKDALDTMDVAQDTVLFRKALADLVDALLGSGAAPMTSAVLTRAEPEPEIWAILGGAVGAPTSGTWDQAKVAIGRHLAAIAQNAADEADPAWRPLLDRIQRRAAP